MCFLASCTSWKWGASLNLPWTSLNSPWDAGRFQNVPLASDSADVTAFPWLLEILRWMNYPHICCLTAAQLLCAHTAHCFILSSWTTVKTFHRDETERSLQGRCSPHTPRSLGVSVIGSQWTRRQPPSLQFCTALGACLTTEQEGVARELPLRYVLSLQVLIGHPEA